MYHGKKKEKKRNITFHCIFTLLKNGLIEVHELQEWQVMRHERYTILFVLFRMVFCNCLEFTNDQL